MKRFGNHITGTLAEYVVGKYLKSNGFQIRNYGGVDASILVDHHNFKPDEVESMYFGELREFIIDTANTNSKEHNLKEIKNLIAGYSDSDKFYNKLRKGGIVLKPIVDKHFKQEEKSRKDDIFYFKENDIDKWLDFLNKDPNDIPKTKENFFRLNLLITNYIDQLWYKHGRKNRLRPKITADELGTGMDFDIVGYKNDYYAIEVKLNSSRLSKLQKVRLGILKRYGFNVMIINVKMSHKTIENAFINGIYDYDNIEESTNIGLSKVKFYLEEEFKQDIIHLHKKFTTFDKVYYGVRKEPY